jgi:hypothetical protein
MVAHPLPSVWPRSQVPRSNGQNVICRVKLTNPMLRLPSARKLMVCYHQLAWTAKVLCGDLELQEGGWFRRSAESFEQFRMRVEYHSDALSEPHRPPKPSFDPGLPQTLRGKTQRVVHSGEFWMLSALCELAHRLAADFSATGRLRRLGIASDLSNVSPAGKACPKVFNPI